MVNAQAEARVAALGLVCIDYRRSCAAIGPRQAIEQAARYPHVEENFFRRVVG